MLEQLNSLKITDGGFGKNTVHMHAHDTMVLHWDNGQIHSSILFYYLNVFCSDAAYTVGLILLNEKAIETTDANKKKSKFMVIYHVYTVHGGSK